MVSSVTPSNNCCSSSGINLTEFIEKIRKCFADIKHLIAAADVVDDVSIDNAVLSAVAEGQSAPTRLRHAQQDIWIVKQMISAGLIPRRIDQATQEGEGALKGSERAIVDHASSGADEAQSNGV